MHYQSLILSALVALVAAAPLNVRVGGVVSGQEPAELVTRQAGTTTGGTGTTGAGGGLGDLLGGLTGGTGGAGGGLGQLLGGLTGGGATGAGGAAGA